MASLIDSPSVVHFKCFHFWCGYCSHRNGLLVSTFVLYPLLPIQELCFWNILHYSLVKMSCFFLFKILQWLLTIFSIYPIFFTFKICVFWFRLNLPNLMYGSILIIFHSTHFCLRVFPLAILTRTYIVILTLLHKSVSSQPNRESLITLKYPSQLSTIAHSLLSL